jgi:hypothetical protein
MAAVSLVPLTGVIASVILIAHFAKGNDSGLMVLIQLVNLAGAVVVFFVIGGYGISRFSQH